MSKKVKKRLQFKPKVPTTRGGPVPPLTPSTGVRLSVSPLNSELDKIKDNDLFDYRSKAKVRLNTDGSYQRVRNNKSNFTDTRRYLVYDKVDRNPVCLRRRYRRRTLFGIRFAGHGRGKVRFAKWSSSSHISCR